MKNGQYILIASTVSVSYQLLSFFQEISGNYFILFFLDCSASVTDLIVFFSRRTVLAVAGEDFAIVASDTRLSEGYSIHSRDSPKCYKL